jgi:hypothetical protein
MRFQFSVRWSGSTGWKLRLYAQRSRSDGDPVEMAKLFWKFRLQREDTGLLSCLLIFHRRCLVFRSRRAAA